MLLHVPSVLDAAEVAECRRALEQAPWADGRATVGHVGGRVKDNVQVPEAHPISKRLGDLILSKLERNALFIAAALPLKVCPPIFNRYMAGQTYGNHVDGAIRDVPGTPHRIRTDLSATLFLTAPEEYEGGELMIEDTYGVHKIKLPAGDMVLYPSTSLHRVQPVTRGARVASFFWVQSMIREDSRRTLLLDLDTSIQQLNRTVPDNAAIPTLTSVYHNLMRLWAET